CQFVPVGHSLYIVLSGSKSVRVFYHNSHSVDVCATANDRASSSSAEPTRTDRLSAIVHLTVPSPIASSVRAIRSWLSSSASYSFPAPVVTLSDLSDCARCFFFFSLASLASSSGCFDRRFTSTPAKRAS